MAGNKPKVAFVGTGGTISSIGRDALDLVDYPDSGSKLEVDQLIEKFDLVKEVVEPVPIRFKAIGSTHIGPKEWLEINKTITKAAADDPSISGFVVTHGTASAEETVYFLNLTLKIEQPVVVVGAQRPASGISTDAAINLLNAARTAADPASRGMGALLMLNDEIQAAREVTKTSTLRMQTFRSPDFGVLGHIDGDGVYYYRAPLRRRMPDVEFDVSELTDLPRVDIVGFTGSTAVGRHIGGGCGEGLKRVQLELGGKSAAIIMPDMPSLPQVAGAMAGSVCFHAGQGCAIFTRLLVPKSQLDECAEARLAGLG